LTLTFGRKISCVDRSKENSVTINGYATHSRYHACDVRHDNDYGQRGEGIRIQNRFERSPLLFSWYLSPFGNDVRDVGGVTDGFVARETRPYAISWRNVRSRHCDHAIKTPVQPSFLIKNHTNTHVLKTDARGLFGCCTRAFRVSRRYGFLSGFHCRSYCIVLFLD